VNGSGNDDPRALRRAAMRKAVIQLVMGVVLLDAVALTIWYGAGLPLAPQRTRIVFTLVWTLVTALTVAVLLRRVRVIRLGR
jgi:hypothetical protein